MLCPFVLYILPPTSTFCHLSRSQEFCLTGLCWPAADWQIFGCEGFLVLYRLLLSFSRELLSPLLLGVLPWQWLVWVCPPGFPLLASPCQPRVDHCREGRQLSPAANSQPSRISTPCLANSTGKLGSNIVSSSQINP